MYMGKGRAADFKRKLHGTEYEAPPKSGAPVKRTLPHGAQIGATGLILSRDLDISQWQEIGTSLCTIDKGIQWAIGDWWAYGDHKYSERKASSIAKKLPYEFGSLMNLGWVARRVKRSFRNEAQVERCLCALQGALSLARLACCLMRLLWRVCRLLFSSF